MLYVSHTHVEYFVYMRMQNPIYIRYVHIISIFLEGATNTFQAGIRLSTYWGKILVALVDLLAEIRPVMVDSYET